MRSDVQQRSDQKYRFALMERCLALVRRGWRHECGAEAVEALALIAIILALLAGISLVFRDRAAAIGDAATAALTRWLEGALGATQIGAAEVTECSRG